MLHFFKNVCLVVMLGLAGFLLSACQPPADSNQTINAADYQRFWVWGRVNPAPYLAHAKELYILQGEVGFLRGQQRIVFSPQGMRLTRLAPAQVWLVYRTTTLQWSPELIQAMIQRLDSWQHYGNQVIGLQIDFDSATAHLDQYAAFLARVRQQLPARYRLSATGLLDWGNAKPATLQQFKHNVDEVVIQTYQGKTTIANYHAYLPLLARLPIPFKIGLVQHGKWSRFSAVAQNPCFKGYVVFLLKD